MADLAYQRIANPYRSQARRLPDRPVAANRALPVESFAGGFTAKIR